MTDRSDAASRGGSEARAGEGEDYELEPPLTKWDEEEPPLELDQGEQVVVGPITDERSRWYIAQWLLVITVVMGAAVLVVALLAPSAVWERVDRVATMVLVPFQTLLGTAVGWYFGGKRN